MSERKHLADTDNGPHKSELCARTHAHVPIQYIHAYMKFVINKIIAGPILHTHARTHARTRISQKPGVTRCDEV